MIAGLLGLLAKVLGVF